MDDVFCDRGRLSDTIFHETERFMLVYDLYPVLKGHVLIIPKRHVEDIIELDSAEWTDLKKIKDECLPIILERYCDSSRSYNMAVQIGKHSGREIDHLHIHILPRSKGDIFSGSPRKLYMSVGHREQKDSSSVPAEVKALRKLFRYKPMNL